MAWRKQKLLKIILFSMADDSCLDIVCVLYCLKIIAADKKYTGLNLRDLLSLDTYLD